MNKFYEVVVVGGGLAGASSAYHLATKTSVKSICVFECGNVGEGSASGTRIPSHAQLRDGDVDPDSLSVFPHARVSGSAVLQDPATSVKMIVNIYPCRSADFIAHHGEEGAVNYLKLAAHGIEVQKKLSNLVNVPARALGSFYVCLKDDVEDFRKEYDLLKKLGAKDIDFWDNVAKVQEVAGPNFYSAIYFPHDAIIDSTSYSKALIKSLPKDIVSVFENFSVARVDTSKGIAVTILADGTVIRSKSIIVATGGLFPDPALTGIWVPCWSYLVGLSSRSDMKNKPKNLSEPYSPNYFSWK